MSFASIPDKWVLRDVTSSYLILAEIYRQPGPAPFREPEQRARPGETGNREQDAAPYRPPCRLGAERSHEIDIGPTEHDEEIGKHLQPIAPAQARTPKPEGRNPDNGDHQGQLPEE